MAASNHLFARKFDASVDEEIFNLIDEKLLHYSNQKHPMKHTLVPNE